MHWIIQNNLYNEHGYQRLIDALDRLEISYQIVKPIPFTDKLISPDEDVLAYDDVSQIPQVEIDGDRPIMVCGATTLSSIAAKRGWKPGSFLNDDFDFVAWKSHYGENLLNHDSVVEEFGKASPTLEEFFIRPCHDTKSFAGRVMQREEFLEWQERVVKLGKGEGTLTPETPVSWCMPKGIYSEYRFFVVGGKIVTGSLYRSGPNIIGMPVTDDNAVGFAQKMVDTWQPAMAFVIDVADTPDGYKVVEINNFNSAGFYAADVMKIVIAIEEMDLVTA